MCFKNIFISLIRFIAITISLNVFAADNNNLHEDKITASKFCSNTAVNTITISPIASGLWTQNSVWPNGVKPTINDDVVVP